LADWLVKRDTLSSWATIAIMGCRLVNKPWTSQRQNQPVTRSYLAVRDIAAMVNHIKTKRGVKK
jgi:hypothetical protein